MKNIVFTFIISCSALLVTAKCGGPHLSAWPEGNSVRPNAVFMVEAYAMGDVIKGLGTKYPVYLQSGNTKIILKIKDTLTSQYSLKQAILAPEKPLEPGLEYTLHIDDLTTFNSDKLRWNDKTSKYEAASWKVEKENDLAAPVWVKDPAVGKKELVHYGCGPATYVHFTSNIKEESAYLVKVTLTSTRTGEHASYYIRPDQDGSFAVGHGMCSGAFYFSEKEYEANFELMDASGNTASWWKGRSVKFTPPETETREE